MSTSQQNEDGGGPDWPCQYCNKVYRIRRSLKDHIRCRHPEKRNRLKKGGSNYRCYFCDKGKGDVVRFRYKTALVDHLESVHDETEESNFKIRETYRATPTPRTIAAKDKSKSAKKPAGRQNKSDGKKTTAKANPRIPDEELVVLVKGSCSLCFGDSVVAGNPESFDSQLRVVYLVHKVLGIPMDQLENYLVKYGNPANWVALCRSCNEILNEAERISTKILALRNELNCLKTKLTVPLAVKLEQDDFTARMQLGQAADDIRQYVQARKLTVR
jgi:hypothetical protein